MGYTTIMDLLISAVIGGILMLLLFRLNENAAGNTFAYGGELTVQETLVSTVRMLEADLRLIGCSIKQELIPDASLAILYADTSTIRFLADIELKGTVDTVCYYLGSRTELEETPNPLDRVLHRRVNGITDGQSIGVVRFSLKYFDVLKNPVALPAFAPTGIASIQIDLELQNPSAYKDDYKSAFWRQLRFAARNLGNR